DKKWLESFFQNQNISQTIRPHELSVALYLKIFKEAKHERRE
ncbi:MAG: 16S rRNA (adenine(1518)-N(6)/adenine(1519)-N(6))-dimethyltransferase, partial [Campylobacter hyointestinalis]